jgi:hypothetical protein
MTPRWWLMGGAFLVALIGAGIYVRRPRTEAGIPRTNEFVRSAAFAAEAALPPSDSSIPAGPPTLLIADAPLTEQSFGVAAELVPDFRDSSQADVMRVAPALSALSLMELRPRIEAESTQCQSSVISACVAELKDCADAAGQYDSSLGRKPTSRAAQELQRTLRRSGTEADALRKDIAKGGGNLPPSAAMAAVELDLAREPERRAAENAVAAICWSGSAQAQLPKACEGGSVVACDALMDNSDGDPSRVSVQRACDVGSRKALSIRGRPRATARRGKTDYSTNTLPRLDWTSRSINERKAEGI